MLATLGIVFIVLLLLGMPIGFTIGITAVSGFINTGSTTLFNIIPQRFFAGINYYTLMALPFFIMAGSIMNKGKITIKLVDFANVIIGHVKGGLAQANVVASIFF